MDSRREESVMRLRRQDVAARIVINTIPTDRMTLELDRVVRLASMTPLNFELISSTIRRFKDLDDVHVTLATVLMIDVTTHASKMHAQRASKARIIETLVDVLYFKPHIPVLAVTICVCIYNLNNAYRQNIARLVRAGGLRIIIRLMEANAFHATVMHFALPVLSQMLMEDDSMFAKARRAGAVPVMVAMLGVHISGSHINDRISVWGAPDLVCTTISGVRYLTNLGLCDINVAQVVKKGAMEFMMVLMKRSRENVEVQCQGFAFFIETMTARVRIVDRFIHVSGVKTVVEGMRACHACVEVQALGCQVFFEIAKSASCRRTAIGTAEARVIFVIAEAMRENRASYDVQRAGLNALYYLLGMSAEALFVGRANGIAYLVHIARLTHGGVSITRGVPDICDQILDMLHAS
jgi:hypothetical protein